MKVVYTKAERKCWNIAFKLGTILRDALDVRGFGHVSDGFPSVLCKGLNENFSCGMTSIGL